jgi:hypothetical protein
VLTFPTAQTSLTDTDFTVTVNGGSVVVSSASWTGAVITLVLASACVYGDVIVVTFVRTGGTTNVTNNITAEAELTTYIAGLTTTLSSAQLKKINDFILTRKSGWAVADLDDVDDVEYLLAGETAESSLKNLVKNVHHAVAVNAPAFTAFEGWAGDGISSYIDTNYNPSTGSTYKQDDASISIYCRTNKDEAAVDVGVRESAANKRSYILLRNTGATLNVLATPVNENYAIDFPTFVNDNSQGMYYATRDGVNQCKIYKNKTLKDTGTTSSAAIYNGNAFICAVNNGGSAAALSTKQYSFVSFGKAYSQDMITVGTDTLEAYMDSLEKGVIA